MRRQDVISIFITFAVGFIAGGFLYVTHFSKLFGDSSVPTQAEIAQFSIIGEAYGGCGDVCPAFQMRGDGSFRYIFYTSVGGERQLREGTVPFSTVREVKRSLEKRQLERQSEAVSQTTCNSSSGGNDFVYTITFDGEEYVLDSCETAVDGDGAIWNSLIKVWSHLGSID